MYYLIIMLIKQNSESMNVIKIGIHNNQITPSKKKNETM